MQVFHVRDFIFILLNGFMFIIVVGVVAVGVMLTGVIIITITIIFFTFVMFCVMLNN